MNKPWSRYFHGPDLPFEIESETTCAVPVLPAISVPSIGSCARPAVPPGALDERVEARVREGCRLVAGDSLDHALVAARHKNVGDGLRQVLPDGQGEQVVLAAFLGDGDEVPLVEARQRYIDANTNGIEALRAAGFALRTASRL